MQFRPLNDRILVELIYQDDVTEGGIYIPDSAKETPVRGKVVFVGEGGYLESGNFRPTQLKVGDTVLIPKYGGSLINMDGKDLVVLLESDVFGIVGTA